MPVLHTAAARFTAEAAEPAPQTADALAQHAVQTSARLLQSAQLTARKSRLRHLVHPPDMIPSARRLPVRQQDSFSGNLREQLQALLRHPLPPNHPHLPAGTRSENKNLLTDIG